MQIHRVLWDYRHRLCWLPDQPVWRCYLGNSCNDSGFRWANKLLSRRYQWAAASKGNTCRWCLPAYISWDASVAFKCVSNWNLPRNLKGHFSCADWGVFLLPGVWYPEQNCLSENFSSVGSRMAPEQTSRMAPEPHNQEACLCGLHWSSGSGKAWEWVLGAGHVCGYSEVVHIHACLYRKWSSPAPLSPSKIPINPCPFGWCFKISNWITSTHNLITSLTAAFELVPRTSECCVWTPQRTISDHTSPQVLWCKSCWFPDPHIFQVSSLWCKS